MRSVGQRLTVTLKGGVLPLRPSLRCALLLADRAGGFPGLFHDLQDGSLTAICATLRAAGADLPQLEAQVMATGVNKLGTELLGFVISAAGLDVELDDREAETAPDPAPKGKPLSYTEFLEGLYEKATGWLGWPPATALDATPGEIIHAIRGRTELLRQLFGSGEDDTPKVAPDLTAKAKVIFGAMGTVKPEMAA